MRTVPEWIASNPDAKIPPRVKLRIFERDKGRCHLSGRLIRAGEAWDAEHIVALCNGGEHRESNLAPALRDKHQEKTRADVAEKSRNYRKRAKHIGVFAPRKKMQGRKFQPASPQRTASRPLIRHGEG